MLKITAILMLLGAFMFTACGGDSEGGDPAAASTNADLSAITLSTGTLSPAFDAATIAYTASVANTADSIMVAGTEADASSTVSTPVILSGLVVGVAQTATITVTSQSGMTKSYTVAVTRSAPDSTNADLSGITLTSGTLSSVFDAATITYNASVENTVDSVTLTGTKADANATVSAPVLLTGLVVGERQAATITVTAQNSATKVYTVTVTRFGVDYTSTNQSSIILKYVPAGSFQRDATSTNISTITSAYRMSEKEITRAQFVAVTGLADPSNLTYSSSFNDPVQMVNWYHALVFCNKLSIAEGLTPVYTIRSSTVPADWDGTPGGAIGVPTAPDAIWDAAVCNWSASGYRLPTEMEWMWAAMGATSGSGYTYPTFLTGFSKPFAGSNATNASGNNGTNALGDYAWYGYTSGNAGTTTHPVGTRVANELGLYDMSGNVWEWCWDWYAAYPTLTQTDYSGAASGPGRVLRGGFFYGDASYCHVALRSLSNPVFQYYYIGFRVVRP